MKWKSKVIKYGILLVLIAIQFIPVSRDNPPQEELIPAPQDVVKILQKSCFDCHSHQTRWPWYSYVAPVSWLVAHDVNEGREDLNFSKWNHYTPKKRHELLEEIVEETNEGKMPPWFYTLVHPSAKISELDRQMLENWARSLQKNLPAEAHSENEEENEED